jgi:hypothetical protein
MNDFKSLWAASPSVEPVQKKVYEVVPDGIYSAQLTEGSIDLSHESVSLVYTLTTEGAYNRRKLFANYVLSEKGIHFLKQALLALGANELKTEAVSSPDDLQTLLNSVNGVACDVSVKGRTYMKNDGTTGNSHNVYVNSLNNSVPKASGVVGLPPKLDAEDVLPF